jgi:hypothetical protein
MRIQLRGRLWVVVITATTVFALLGWQQQEKLIDGPILLSSLLPRLPHLFLLAMQDGMQQ